MSESQSRSERMLRRQLDDQGSKQLDTVLDTGDAASEQAVRENLNAHGQVLMDTVMIENQKRGR